MNNYHMPVHDLPRRLRFPLPLHIVVSHENALGTWRGKRPDTIEFALRISSTDKEAVDFQDGIKYVNSFPHLFIKKPGSDFQNSTFAPRNAFVLIYSGKYADTFREYGIPLDPQCWNIVMNKEILELRNKIDELSEEIYSPGIIDRIDSLGWRLLHELYLQRPDDSAEKQSIKEEKILKIASYFRRHYREKLDHDEILRVNGLSRRSFFREWGKRFSKSPAQYILELKMQEAARLLAYDIPISEIAMSLNIQDFSSFAGHFKKHFGVSPREFRKELTQGKETR